MIYKRSWLNRGIMWLIRFRYRKGYGVQSPSVFHFIRHVIFESTPYYEYQRLHVFFDSIGLENKKVLLPRKRYELIFRISNEIKAKAIIEIGTQTGLGSISASMARKKAQCYLLNKEDIAIHTIQSMLNELPTPIIQLKGDISRLLTEQLTSLSGSDGKLILFNCENFTESECTEYVSIILQNALPNDCVLISGLQRSCTVRKLWKKWSLHPSVRLSFDLYEAGLLFFKPCSSRGCYLINY